MSRVANIFVDQGASFEELIDLKNDDGTEFVMTDYVVVAKAKKHYQSAQEITFGTSINPVTNDVTFTLTAEQTKALSICSYIYYIYIINTITGKSIKLVEGTMVVSPGIAV